MEGTMKKNNKINKNNNFYRRCFKTKRLQPFSAIFFMLVVCLLVQISVVSAAEFDNVKSYNPQTREVTITNMFGLGSVIGKARLDTPLNVVVPRGYQKVAEFTIWAYDDYSNALKQFEFSDMKNGKTKINRDYDLKYLTTEEVLVDDYVNVINGNATSYEKVGEHYETQQVWKDINPADLKKNEQLTIGVFTEVRKGDYVDWIPTIYGIKIEEWATWTENLNTSLIAYFKLDEASGNAIDSYGYKNLTETGSVGSQTGIINGGRGAYSATDFFSEKNFFATSGNQNFTQSYWIYRTADITTNEVAFSITNQTENYFYLFNGFQNNNSIKIEMAKAGQGASINLWSDEIPQDTWTYVAFTYDGNSTRTGKLYINGAEVASGTAGSPITDLGTTRLTLGGTEDTGSLVHAYLDEVGYWNRTLNSSEITDLYNSGSGLTFGQVNIDITLNSPNDNSTELQNTNIDFNITSVSNSLQNISLYIDGVLNETKNISGSTNTTIFTKSFDTIGNYTWGVTVCESSQCSSSENRTLIIGFVKENSRTYNSTAYDTSYQTYSINVTANSSLTNVYLLFNNSPYSMTNQGSGIWSYSRDIPTTALGNNSISFNFTYAGSNITSTSTTYQYVNETLFGLCNSSITDDFLNISFKDESNSSEISASVPSSTFGYYLGTGTVTKTYSLVNNTANAYYSICGYPNLTMHVDPYFQYESSGYPQRIWNPSVQDYTPSLTNETLYLLSSTDGIYVTFQVTNPANQVIENASITITREIGGSTTIIGQATTGADGIATFWLNPNYIHTITVSKTGFTTSSSTITPTQSTYTIVLGQSSVQQIQDYSQGINIQILPPITTALYNNTVYNFNMTINSSYWSLDEFGMYLKLRNGTRLNSTSSSSSTGGTIYVLQNTSNYEAIGIGYYYTVNGTNMTSDHWFIIEIDDSGFSINTFFTDLNMYIDSGLFGLDVFGKTLLIYLTLFIAIGIVSYKYGAVSPMAVSMLAFLVIYTFDVVLGLLESPVDAIPNMYTWLIGIITAVIIVREVTSRG